MKHFIKAISILLLFATTLLCFAACGDSGEVEESTNNVSGNEVSKPVDPGSIEVPVKNMGGREFNVLCWDFGAGSSSILGYTGEIMYAEENPSAVDQAKKVVVDYIEETYNCTINGELTHIEYTPQIIKRQVTSGLHYYDIVFDSLSTTANMVSDSLLLDLRGISTIDLSHPWWDQNAVNDLSIAGKVYFACGDINTYDDQGTCCVLFNKTLKSKYGINEDFYQLVRDGKWTFDKFKEICKRNITSNTNGDEVLDEKDTWALGTERYNIYVQLIAAGQKIAQKDENDLPYLTLSKSPEATYSILGDILEFYNDQQTVMVANAPPYTDKGFQNVWEATVHKAFLEGRELFYMCSLINSASFRVMEDEFGILPIPMVTADQDRYYHTLQAGQSTFMYIPEGTTNVEDVGLIVTAIAKESKRLVTPAYYDVQLKYRDSRDDESGEMLDLIFSTRTFDVADAFNWGGIRDQYCSMSKNDIVSRFDRILSAAELTMEAFIEGLTEEE